MISETLLLRMPRYIDQLHTAAKVMGEGFVAAEMALLEFTLARSISEASRHLKVGQSIDDFVELALNQVRAEVARLRLIEKEDGDGHLHQPA